MEVFPVFRDNADDYGVIKMNMSTYKFVLYDHGDGGRIDMEICDFNGGKRTR